MLCCYICDRIKLFYVHSVCTGKHYRERGAFVILYMLVKGEEVLIVERFRYTNIIHFNAKESDRF